MAVCTIYKVHFSNLFLIQPPPLSLLPPWLKSELTRGDLNTVLLHWPGESHRPVGPFRSSHMDYTGNGIQNWFLKEIEWFIYYVKRPLRGLLKEIPKIHLFSPWIENTCLCTAYDIAFTVQTINLKRIVNKCFLILLNFYGLATKGSFF